MRRKQPSGPRNHHWRCYLPFIVLLGLLGGPVRAQRRPLPVIPDSRRPAGPLAAIHSPVVRVAVAVGPPLLLIAHGLLTRNGHGRWLGSSYAVQEEVHEAFPGFHTDLDNYSRYVPAVAVFGLSLAGVPARHDLVERALLLEMATILSTETTVFIKDHTGVARPDNPADLSAFPSHHTAAAFAGATFLAEEYGGRSLWYSVAGYSVATATGAIRLLNNRHWISDVTVAAGIGILSTEAAYAVYPLIKKVVFRGHTPHGLLLPAQPLGSRAGVALVWLLR